MFWHLPNCLSLTGTLRSEDAFKYEPLEAFFRVGPKTVLISQFP